MPNNIYKDARTIFILCKIVGITSLKNIFSGKLVFKWGIHCTGPIISFFIHCYTMHWSVNANPTPPNSRYWFYFVTVKEFSRMISILHSDKHIPSIIENIYKFDLEYIPLDNQPCKKPKYFLKIYFILSIIVHTCNVLEVIINGFSMITLTKILSKCVTLMFPIPYFFLCHELCVRFQSLKLRWQTKMAEIFKANITDIVYQNMELERLAHAKLCDLVDNIRLAFGFQITTFLFFIFLEHLGRFYFHIYMLPAFVANHPYISESFLDILQPYMFLINTWICIYLIAYMSDLLTESSKSIISDLRNIPIWKLPHFCNEQVEIFLSQVKNSNTEITASGLFVINKTLLSSIVMSLATYIIVLIQLSQDIGKVLT
ncbi:uncharacterized protein LOC126902525 [Daktulosphaira vitifoliae]|uniref:uncharacterized protein LOC126902525 n=1 Tax=Daktulosphaira vitifoliae TaxID=58002 RepID=UPI0021A9792D|nr:uncharacterized protein LOC126902525 [Daktulosphaira vitifoliae]